MRGPVSFAPRAQVVSCGHWVSENPHPGADGPVRAFAAFDFGSGRRRVLGGEFTRTGDASPAHVAPFDGGSAGERKASVTNGITIVSR